MSGVVKGVKKVFKAVVKVVKKIAKPLIIAAAVYFTAGLALSAFPATAGFAASLPGFGMSVGAGGATTATGIFSKAASAIGLGSGLSSGAVASATAAGTIPAAGSGGIMSMVLGSGAPTTAATTTLATAPVAAAGMSMGEKLLLASMGTQAVGAFMQPGLEEQYTEAKRWRGAFYGTYSDGSTTDAEAQQAGAQPATPEEQAQVAPPSGGAPVAPQAPAQNLMAQMPSVANMAPAAGAPSVQEATAMAKPIENEPVAETKQLMESVRYV